MIEEKYLLEVLSRRLSKKRFEHSLQVARVARDMAKKFGVDEKKAYITGLVHDYAKGISGQDLLNLALDTKLEVDPVDYRLPDLLHAPVGALLVKKDFAITDPETLQAIACHTLGSTHMNALDKIIYLADMIEPGRDYPGLERLKCLAMRDLDQGMLFGLDSTIKYCIYQNRIIHPRTVDARNHFLVSVHGGE
ncbi:bis(5'-nucleosyl)-tetraphosphatase (symmetrical) YqeK [Syntrophomonas erecta]